MTQSARGRRLRRAGLALAAVATAAALYTGLWHVLASRAAGHLDAWASGTAGATWSGSHDGLTVGGFPFSLEIDLTQPRAAWRSGFARTTWAGPGLVMRARPWRPSVWTLDLPTDQVVTVRTARGSWTVDLAVAAGRIVAETAGGRLRGLRASLDDLAATWGDGGRNVAAARLTAFVDAGDPDAPGMTLAADGVALPPGIDLPFGRGLDRASASLRWRGALPGPGDLVAELDAWREAGGTVDVEDLRIAWPPLDVAGAGTLALDGDLRPLGAFRVDLSGYRELLAVLEDAGAIRRGQAGLLATMLDFMAGQPEDGVRTLSVDLSMQHGMLSVGPLRVMPLPPLLDRDVAI